MKPIQLHSGRKVCLQIAYKESRIRRIFAALPPEAFLFYFGYAMDVGECVEILWIFRLLAK